MTSHESVFDPFRDDHRHVLSRLEMLERAIGSGGPMGPATEHEISSVVTLLGRQFVSHVTAEDRVLYPALIEAFPEAAQGLEPLKAEHVEMRSMLARLAALLAQPPAGDRYEQIVVLTRDLQKARRWLRSRARGSERYGIVVSSQAERLKPHAVDVRSPVDPVHWFLNGKEDVRSSYYLEDVATEFHVQGLELDWSCVVWDADFRHTGAGWDSWSFRGHRWERIRAPERQAYLKNAYRVLLTRARQGMVIVVPEGDAEDATRAPAWYDGTYEYLRRGGLPVLP